MESKIVQLVNAFYGFLQRFPEASVEDFCRYHLARRDKGEGVEGRHPNYYAPDDAYLLAGLIGRLGRFGEVYAKKLMADLPLDNIDDCIYLILLEHFGSPTKSELIAANLSEYTTGIEVIRRLVRAGLAGEKPDEQDRRSKRLFLTEQGRQTVHAVREMLGKVAGLMFPGLPPEDLHLLVHLLTHLDRVHTRVYDLHRGQPIEVVEQALHREAPAVEAPRE